MIFPLHNNSLHIFDMVYRGLSPAECEVNFLKIIKSLEYYGIVQYEVTVSAMN